MTSTASSFGTSAAAIGNSIITGMSKPPSSGSTMSVVPRLLIKNPAMPSHRRTVPSLASNASAPNGWVSGSPRLTWHGWTLSPGSTAPTNSYERWPRSRCSGRRPGRRAGDTGHDLVGSAVNVAAEQLVGPRVGSTIRDYGWVFEADITACFDEINHQALLDRVRRRISDKPVLGLVKAFLKAGVLTEDGLNRDTWTGTPQGGILSPLLANVALSTLDEHFTWSGRGGRPRRCQLRPDARCHLGWSLNPPTPARVLGLGDQNLHRRPGW